MYSAEFYKRCNIRLPELFSQAVHQRQEGTFVLLNTKDVPSIRLFRARKYYSCHFKGQKWASSRKISRISASADLSPDDAAYMRFLGDDSQENGSGVYFGKATSKDELIALRESAARASLLKKLSDANIYGRHLQRQLREKEDALMKCKNELETMSDDIQLLVGLAQEIVKGGVQPGTRKINGKYIHSHLALTLKDIHGRLLEQVNNIEGACYRDVSLVWYGLAEDVKVMGSFDGWSQGFQLSPEFDGSQNQFSATMTLRPGRYQIKFLVDGEWQVSPALPLVGEGLTVNNLLVVE